MLHDCMRAKDGCMLCESHTYASGSVDASQCRMCSAAFRSPPFNSLCIPVALLKTNKYCVEVSELYMSLFPLSRFVFRPDYCSILCAFVLAKQPADGPPFFIPSSPFLHPSSLVPLILSETRNESLAKLSLF